MNRQTINLLCGIFILLTVFAYLTKDLWVVPIHEFFANSSKNISEIEFKFLDGDLGKTFPVKKVQVLKGDSFSFTLEDGSRVLGHIKTKATEDSKQKVIDLINHCENPRIHLVHKEDEGWLIEFKFHYQGNEISLDNWLTANKLGYK